MFCVDGLSHPLCLRTKAVKPRFCLSDWALDLLWRLMSLVRYVVVSLSVMDCLYPRDPPQPVRKKNTVALARARKMCVIFCPLDMKGLLGAATVMGSLMYGVGPRWNGAVNMHLRSPSLEDCPDDEEFLSNFDQQDGQTGPVAQQRYPPVALAECAADIMSKRHKVRRLHLVIVDLWRPWKINQGQANSLTDQLRRLSPCPEVDNTTPMAPVQGKTPLHCRRFVYGYSLDGSDFPCYFLWPVRTAEGSFWLLESQTRQYVDLEQAGFLKPLGLRHFYDAFSLRAEVSIRTAAISASVTTRRGV